MRNEHKISWRQNPHISYLLSHIYCLFSSKFLISLLVFIGVVHLIATLNFWYWTYLWFDAPMHFLGGVWLALFYFWLQPKTQTYADDKQTNAEKSQRESASSLRKSALLTIVNCLGFVALIGVLWEFFEFGVDFVSSGGYSGAFKIFGNNVKDLYRDTLGDLLADLLGGLVVFVLSFWRKPD